MILNDIRQAALDMPEQTAGKVMLGIGGSGAIYQLIVDGLQLFALAGNALLIIGGLYLMYHKIADRRRNRRTGDE